VLVKEGVVDKGALVVEYQWPWCVNGAGFKTVTMVDANTGIINIVVGSHQNTHVVFALDETRIDTVLHKGMPCTNQTSDETVVAG